MKGLFIIECEYCGAVFTSEAITGKCIVCGAPLSADNVEIINNNKLEPVYNDWGFSSDYRTCSTNVCMSTSTDTFIFTT